MKVDRIDRSLVGSLDVLISCLEPDADDVVEFSLHSRGKAATVYPRERRDGACFKKLFSILDLSAHARRIFWSLLLHIPAERHAVRLSSHGAVSIFFKVDVPIDGIASISCAINEEQSAGPTPASVFFRHLGSPACGMALEISAAGDSRLRFYHMIRSREEACLVSELAVRHLGLDDSTMNESMALWSRLAGPTSAVVVNVGASSSSGASIKLEFPEIAGSIIPGLTELSECETEICREAVDLARALNRDVFSYVGIRWSGHDRRELTFYVDARALLGREAT